MINTNGGGARSSEDRGIIRRVRGIRIHGHRVLTTGGQRRITSLKEFVVKVAGDDLFGIVFPSLEVIEELGLTSLDFDHVFKTTGFDDLVITSVELRQIRGLRDNGSSTKRNDGKSNGRTNHDD